ncbi:MAG: tetratricopeptide repeat protein [Planctomycetota bacterium]
MPIHVRIAIALAGLGLSCIALGRTASGQIIQAEEGSWIANTRDAADSVSRFMLGREQSDAENSRGFYQAGDALFREATGLHQSDETRDQAKKRFEDAAKQFRKASEAAPGSALSQDAMFMYAESLFFADELTDAAEAYQKLQKDHPKNRHSDQIGTRLFSITQYWIDTEKANETSWLRVNLFDETRPAFDADGHAVRVLDQIRYDDPTGRLADDATMAAAAEYMRQEDYEMADEFLTDLRQTFPDSEHFFMAHLLGIQCKLALYRGPNYSGLMLEEAEELVQKTRQRFPDQARQEEYVEMLARASAQVTFRRAEHLAARARYREKKREYRAASIYYQEILEKYPDAPQAQTAREKLERLTGRPPVPTQRLSWLTRIFPDSKPTEPLELKSGTVDSPTQSGVLR